MLHARTGRTAFAVAISAAALGAAFLFPAASAEAPPVATVCGGRQRVLDALRDQYGEVPIGMGMSNAGSMVELLVGPSGSTWSLVVTLADGRACLAAAGEAWRAVPTAAHREKRI